MSLSLNSIVSIIQKTRTLDGSGGWVETPQPPINRWAFFKPLTPLSDLRQNPQGHALFPATFLWKERYEVILRDQPPLGPLLEIHWKNKILSPLNTPQPTLFPGYLCFQALVLKTLPEPQERI
jgi:hypothetical protein